MSALHRAGADRAGTPGSSPAAQIPRGGASALEAGRQMHALAGELFPICRSITGDGLRETLRRIQQRVPISIHEVPTSTEVLDWTIPNEWNISDACIRNGHGERVVDFHRSNLHVVNYSAPVRARLRLAQLQPHLHSLPDRPQAIPYRTSYYKRDWGFCLSHAARQQLEEDDYEVCIDSTLAPGSLSYGELLLPGETGDEFLISCHCCHPSLANDNLSGVVLAVALARQLGNDGIPSVDAGAAPAAARPRHLRHSYRFLFVPGTIGAIAWLARNEERASRIKHGLVLTCVGDRGAMTYKQSRRGDAVIDRAMHQVLARSGAPHRIIEFFPCGYDERQYCSPGFNLPVGCFMRSQHGTFPEYHTSADNLEFITPESLGDSFATVLEVMALIESGNVGTESAAVAEGPRLARDKGGAPGPQRFINLKPKGEPQLGKYGLYDGLGGDVTAALWVLNFSDGRHSLTEIARRAGLPFDSIIKAAHVLSSRGLIREANAA